MLKTGENVQILVNYVSPNLTDQFITFIASGMVGI